MGLLLSKFNHFFFSLYSSTVELGTVNAEIDVRFILRAYDSLVVKGSKQTIITLTSFSSFFFFLVTQNAKVSINQTNCTLILLINDKFNKK